MNAVVAVVGLLLAAGAPAAEAKAPQGIADFYAVLAHDQKVDPVLVQRGGAWKYASTVQDDKVTGLGPLVVDGKNGFMQFEYEWGAERQKVELALFNAADGRHFVAMNASAHTERNEFSTFTLFEFTGAAYRDVTQEMGLPASLAVKDFMDESYVPPPRPLTDEYVYTPEEAALVVIHLPRQGTTVTVELKQAEHRPEVENGEKLQAAGRKLLAAHRKYKAIDVAWSKADAKFTLAQKR